MTTCTPKFGFLTPLGAVAHGVWFCRSGWPIRTYPWGVLEPMASTHSDLLALKRGLFEESPELLKTVTEENFTRYRAAQVPSLWRSTRRMFSSK